MEIINKKQSVIVMAVMLFAVLMMNIETTGIYVVLPAIKAAFGLNDSQLPWIATIHLLMFASLLAVGGRLGDKFGHRNVLILGLIIFAAASWIAGSSHGLTSELIGRAGQGLSTALMWPNTTAIAFDVVAKKNRGLAISIVSSAVGFGLAIGPLTSGFIASYFSWRWYLLMNTPLSIATIILTFLFVKNKVVNKSIRIDMLGAIILVFLLALLTLSINQMDVNATFHAYAFVLGVATLLMAVIFVFIERNVSEPILPSLLIRNREFLTACVLRFLTGMPIYSLLFIFGLYAQHHLGLNTLKAGLVFLPMTLTIGLLSPVAGKIIDRLGGLSALVMACLANLSGFILLIIATHVDSTIFISLALLLPGIGFSFASPAALTIGMSVAPDDAKGAATGIFYTVSVCGGLLGVALCGMIQTYFSLPQQFSPIALILALGMLAVLSVGALSISCLQIKQCKVCV